MLKLRISLIARLFQGCLLVIFLAQTSNLRASNPDPVTWSNDIPAALKEAELEHKMVLVDILPDWDSSGKKTDAEIFADPKVQKLLAAFMWVKVNPKSVAEAEKIADQLGASFKFPLVCIFDYRGALAERGGGFEDANQLQRFLTDFQRRFFDNPLEPFEVKWNVSGSKIQTYSFHLPEAEIANSPIWLENENSPPLAPRKAIQLAEDRLREITNNGWRFEGIRLAPIDAKGHWVYRVIFSRNAPPDAFGGWMDIGRADTVPVLMNGYVPKAELTHIWTSESGEPRELR